MSRPYRWEKIIRKVNDVNERLFNTAPRSTLKKNVDNDFSITRLSSSIFSYMKRMLERKEIVVFHILHWFQPSAGYIKELRKRVGSLASFSAGMKKMKLRDKKKRACEFRFSPRLVLALLLFVVLENMGLKLQLRRSWSSYEGFRIVAACQNWDGCCCFGQKWGRGGWGLGGFILLGTGMGSCAAIPTYHPSPAAPQLRWVL